MLLTTPRTNTKFDLPLRIQIAPLQRTRLYIRERIVYASALILVFNTSHPVCSTKTFLISFLYLCNLIKSICRWDKDEGKCKIRWVIDFPLMPFSASLITLLNPHKKEIRKVYQFLKKKLHAVLLLISVLNFWNLINTLNKVPKNKNSINLWCAKLAFFVMQILITIAIMDRLVDDWCKKANS